MRNSFKKMFTHRHRLNIIVVPMEADTIDITLCPMSEKDLDAVLEIEERSFPRPWNRSHFIAELTSPHSFPFVAFDSQDKIIGYICTMVVLDEGHILDVAVAPELRGKRVGDHLVRMGLNECRSRGADYVSLEVRASNLPAITLYKNIGFTEMGIRKRYYENGEDALMMEYIFKENGADAI